MRINREEAGIAIWDYFFIYYFMQYTNMYGETDLKRAFVEYD